MPTIIRGDAYFRTAEACGLAGISRITFFRWIRSGKFEDVCTADRHGWRLFTEDDVNRLCGCAHLLGLEH
jgi:predicted site-specific integrase-resolvase